MVSLVWTEIKNCIQKDTEKYRVSEFSRPNRYTGYMKTPLNVPTTCVKLNLKYSSSPSIASATDRPKQAKIAQAKLVRPLQAINRPIPHCYKKRELSLERAGRKEKRKRDRVGLAAILWD